MKKKRYSLEQIVAALKQHEASVPVSGEHISPEAPD